MTKRLILQGADLELGLPVVDAGGNGSAITLSADGITLEGFKTLNTSDWLSAGIKVTSNNNTITGNNASNNYFGIYLDDSSNNAITGNTATNNCDNGIHIYGSSNNIITGNNCSNNEDDGIILVYSSNNTITGNTATNSDYCGIYLSHSSNNIITGNNCSNNEDDGIYLEYSTNSNNIYYNNFINNTDNVYSYNSNNIWNSTSPIAYIYNGTTFTRYFGNYWDDYTGNDIDNDGIGDTSYSIDSDNDNYPLMKPFENYFMETENIKIVSFSTDKEIYNAKEDINFFLSIYAPRNISNALIEVKGVKSTKGVYFVSYSNLTDLFVGLNNITFTKKLPSCLRCAGLGAGTYFINVSVTYDAEVVTATHCIVLIKHIFDTGSGMYPSISGVHNGTITPSSNLTVLTLYTYPCAGTGGHTKYVAFYNATTGEEIANGTWKGYQGLGDYHYLEFESPFVLRKNETYNYTIQTGSYPQIHHTPSLKTANGWINCTEFTDDNGRTYTNWIPAFRLS